MGAGGSTAASCSSLDVNCPRQQQHKLNRRRQEALLKYRKPERAMKQANSYFDLTATQNHLIEESKHRATGCSDEAYTLSSANIGHMRPFKVVGEARSVHQLQNKKCVVGPPIVNKIHQQKQRASELRKFSDSLPSLNNLIQQHPAKMSPGAMLSQLDLLTCNNNYNHHVQANRNHHNNHLRSAKQAPGSRKQVLSGQQAAARRNDHHYHDHHHLVQNDTSELHLKRPRSSGQQQQQLIKRATSLSSLHNLNQQQQQFRMSSPAYRQLEPSPPSCDLQQQQMRIEAQQHGQYQVSAPLARKIFKYKQVGQNGAGQCAKKCKQKQQQQRHSPQQGCPVLPPLPRSQSLHELIQLRATENGQRMRNTGTLRAPLGASEAGGKVNLVAELLESRRQKASNSERPSADTISSPEAGGSSSDDGIHSTKQLSSPNTSCSTDNDIDIDNSTSSQPRLFKRNEAAPNKFSENKLSVSNSELCDNDEQDLNELAKFLYQFKQRQANKLNEAEKEQAKSNGAKLAPEASGQKSAQATNATQQSPNSTTSSSGFASSSCTSNSIKSSSGSERNLAPSRKKYPAPLRPAQKAEEQISAKKLSAVKEQISKSNKCLISGKLKLSSSLLSIVDEYNNSNSSNSNNSSFQQEATSPKLASVLLSGQRAVMSERSEQQLEQLKLYTQMRQISQSELALNHLSTSECLLVERERKRKNKNNQQQQQQNKSQYKSKLINLIKRISDNKSEACSGEQSNSAGGHQLEQQRMLARGQISTAKAINQSERQIVALARSNVPRHYSNETTNCNSAHERLSKDERKEGFVRSNKEFAAWKEEGKAWLRSESVCDLNFDCDFELIKNCASISEHKQGACVSQPATNKPAASLLEANQFVGQPQPIKAPVMSANKGSLELGVKRWPLQSKKQAACCETKSKQAAINLAKGEPNNWQFGLPVASKLSSSIASLAAAADSSQLQVNEQQRRKWSANNWLMNGASGPKKRCELQSSGRPTIGSECEANRLLEDLNESLDLVGSAADERGPFSRKAALNYWHKSADSSSDEDDDDDYASINRAMINATFDVEPNSLSSDSFTFGGGGGGGGKIKSGAISKQAAEIRTKVSNRHAIAPASALSPSQAKLFAKRIDNGRRVCAEDENVASAQLIKSIPSDFNFEQDEQQVDSRIFKKTPDNNGNGSRDNIGSKSEPQVAHQNGNKCVSTCSTCLQACAPEVGRVLSQDNKHEPGIRSYNEERLLQRNALPIQGQHSESACRRCSAAAAAADKAAAKVRTTTDNDNNGCQGSASLESGAALHGTYCKRKDDVGEELIICKSDTCCCHCLSPILSWKESCECQLKKSSSNGGGNGRLVLGDADLSRERKSFELLRACHQHHPSSVSATCDAASSEDVMQKCGVNRDNQPALNANCECEEAALSQKRGSKMMPLIKRFNGFASNERRPQSPNRHLLGGGGAARLINLKQQGLAGALISRSNSELAYNNKENLLFGKLRNSLLNPISSKDHQAIVLQRQQQQLQQRRQQLAASSQLSAVAVQRKQANNNKLISRTRTQDYNGKRLTSCQLNVDFDDNFILKRKTPNAGLKTRC